MHLFRLRSNRKSVAGDGNASTSKTSGNAASVQRRHSNKKRVSTISAEPMQMDHGNETVTSAYMDTVSS